MGLLRSLFGGRWQEKSSDSAGHDAVRREDDAVPQFADQVASGLGPEHTTQAIGPGPSIIDAIPGGSHATSFNRQNGLSRRNTAAEPLPEQQDTTDGIEQLEYTRLLSLRDQVHMARVEADFAAQYRNQLQSQAQDARNEFLDALGDLQIPEGHTTLRQLRDVVKEHEAALEAQIRVMTEVQARQSRVERSQQHQEATFFGTLYEMLQRSRIWSSAGLDWQWFLQGLGSISQASSSPSFDSKLEEYYDRAGDVALISEELAALEYDYQQFMAKSSPESDHDIPPMPHDENFDETYQSQRVLLETRLMTAIEAADTAKRACISAQQEIAAAGSVTPTLVASEPVASSANARRGPEASSNTKQTFGPPGISKQQMDATEELLRGTTFSGEPVGAEAEAVETDPQQDASTKQRIFEWTEKLPVFEDDPASAFISVKTPRRHSSLTHIRRRGSDVVQTHTSPWDSTTQDNIHRRSSDPLGAKPSLYKHPL